VPAPEPHVLREAVRLFRGFLDAGSHRRRAHDEPFALRFDGEEVPWYGALRSGHGFGNGILLARGARGLRLLRDVADRVDPEPALASRADTISFESVPVGDVPEPRRSILRKAASRWTGELFEQELDVVSHGLAAAHGLPDRRALRRLTAVVRALGPLLADPPLADPAPREPGLLPTLHLRGDLRDPDVSVVLERHADDTGAPEAPPRLSTDTGSWRVVEGLWGVVVGDESELEPGDDPDEVLPFTCYTARLSVVDLDSLAIGEAVFRPNGPESAARTFLRGDWTFELELDGADPDDFPEEIAFDDEAVRAVVARVLAPLGVACVLRPRQELLDAIAEADRRYVESDEPPAFAQREAGDDFDDEEDRYTDADEFDDEGSEFDDEDDEDDGGGPGTARP
jgi:hypothetical protein